MKYKDGTQDRCWRCSNVCGNKGIKSSTMKALVCDVLGLEEFSEEIMDKNIERAVVLNGTVSFHFFDGHIESREYKEKKKGYPRKNLVKDVKK